MILPQEREYNYVTSLWNYIEGRYTFTEKYFYGVNTLDTTTLDEWVQFAWDISFREDFRRTDQTLPGSIVHVNLVANIFMKTRDNFLRVVQIKDEVVGLLRRAIVEVKDWAGNKAVIGKLIGCGIAQETFIDTQDEIDQHMVLFDYRYLEQYERAHL